MVVLRGIDQRGTEVVARIQRMIRSFMVEDELVPMRWLFSTRRYGMTIQYTTTAPGSVHWEGETLSYRNVKFSMDQFRSWVHGLLGELRRVLREELLLLEEGEEVPVIPWDQMTGNPSEKQDGFSFMTVNAPHMPVDGEQYVFNRIFSRKRWQAEFVDGHGQ